MTTKVTMVGESKARIETDDGLDLLAYCYPFGKIKE